MARWRGLFGLVGLVGHRLRLASGATNGYQTRGSGLNPRLSYERYAVLRMATRPETIIKLTDETDADAWVVDRVFERAIILGPAVMLPVEKVAFERVGFTGSIDAMLIEIPEGKAAQGVVGLRNVSFIDCLFQDIAIIGTTETLASIRAAFTNRSGESPAQGSAAAPAEPEAHAAAR